MSEQIDEQTEPPAEPAPAETDAPDQVDEPGPADDDETDDELDDEPERPAEDRPPTPQTPEQMEKQQQQLEKMVAAHVRKLAGIVGDDFPFLIPCELCHPLMPGFRLPREPDDQVKQAVRYAIGDRQPENWMPDQYSRQCEFCGGLGEVLTGSRVNGQQTLGCLACKSKGWLPIGNERTGAIAPPAPEQTAGNGGGEAVPVAGDEDPDVAALRRRGFVVIATEGAR